jgi:RimJ/RimL family protein N-acetyltransferase
MSTTLRDGTAVEIRPIRADDKARLAAGHARLSAESQRRRYLAAKPRLTAADLRDHTEIDGHDHVALVAVLADQPHQLVAVGRFVRLQEDPEAAEFAIVVGDELQGQGLGGRLAELLAQQAVTGGVKRFTATTEVDNEPAQRLIARISNHLSYDHSTGPLREIAAELAA